MNNLTINNTDQLLDLAFVWYEELCRLYRVFSTKAFSTSYSSSFNYWYFTYFTWNVIRGCVMAGEFISLMPNTRNYSLCNLRNYSWMTNHSFVPNKYRIYSINRPGRLLKFWTLRVGANSRWALIKFSPFSSSVVCLFCNKAINGKNKTRRCNKARYL